LEGSGEEKGITCHSGGGRTSLLRLLRSCYVPIVSANEVLEQVKELPPRERRKFFARVHELETASQKPSGEKWKRRIRLPDSASRRRRIFGDKVLPNLVLLARELERY
jgi:ABC-type Na+ transport system ATPase subunit NatA